MHHRRLAVAIAGFCTFLELYAPQPLLPLFVRDFAASEAEASLTVSATTLGVALVAPFIGIIADLVGRKRIIVAAMLLIVVPTLGAAAAPTLETLILCRFLQGMLLPPIFAVTIAYIGDEWPPGEIAAATGLYMTGGGIGGFSGRFLAGLVAHDGAWRLAFVVLAAINLVAALAVLVLLPRERRFVAAENLATSIRMMLGHLRNPRLVGTFAAGFGVLFSFVALFTYINFHLAAPPYRLSTSALGSLFFVYLLGIVITPLTAGWSRRFGRLRLALAAIAFWIAGILLTLAPSLVVIIAGLALASASGFTVQTISTAFLAAEAKEGRSSAIGLYVTLYYIGGSVGAVLPGIAWAWGGWPACVGVVAAMVLVIAALLARSWRER
jgi:YNFM family putative membrane transporter